MDSTNWTQFEADEIHTAESTMVAATGGKIESQNGTRRYH